MTQNGITTTPMTFNTGDGRKFTDEAEAKKHQALITRIDEWMASEGIAEGSRRVTRERIVKWLEFDAQTSDGEQRAAA